MRAATASHCSIEHPKLSARQLVHIDGSFAERLDRAIERSTSAKVINGEAKMIEAKTAGISRL